MTLLWHVVQFFGGGANWTGPEGILAQLYGQLAVSFVAVMAAVLTGGGLGCYLGHVGKGGFVALNSANAARAIPSFALLTLLAIQPVFVDQREGGYLATVIAMWALAVPVVLTNTYAGIRGVQAPLRMAAVAMGMTPLQVLWRVELPLAMPLIMAGARTAAVEVVATATLAAYVGYGDLGTYIFTGLATSDDVKTLVGAILVAALALVVDRLMLLAQRLTNARLTNARL
ncbi:MAG TPA: ABC transporter permease [Acidimicrobiales bacterium]|nr:ABC transporter permease [Acidimicrobiales bacterium]